jgi:gliding motility-associated-like protein
LFLPFHTIASHGTGDEISWECQGNGQYIFRLNFYRDCNGIAAPNSINLTTTFPGVPTINLPKIAQFSIAHERFQVFTECFPMKFELEIHNRFGQLIFSSATPGSGWDGKYNESPSPEGLYVYRLGYKMPYQKKVVKTGTIALIR